MRRRMKYKLVVHEIEDWPTSSSYFSITPLLEQNCIINKILKDIWEDNVEFSQVMATDHY